MEVIKLYETAHSDGYTHTGDGKFFLEEVLAKHAGQKRYGAYSAGPILHWALRNDDGRYWLLKNKTPVSIVGTKEAVEDLKAQALKKLTQEEKEALGL